MQESSNLCGINKTFRNTFSTKFSNDKKILYRKLSVEKLSNFM